jgi:phospholipid/cholesterol/gamma-HCH transport system permease protein
MPLQLLDKLGGITLTITRRFIGFVLFLVRTLTVLTRSRLNKRQLCDQIIHIGIESLPIIILTGSFTGLALALQSYVGFHRFGAEDFVGTVVALGMIRELGPVLAALMVMGRAGSAMAAELGSMRITEQIDALITLQVDPYRYLIAPRFLAGVISMPCLALFSMIFGILGGYIFCVHVLSLNSETYISSIRQFVLFSDIAVGLTKSLFFGLIIAWVGSYYGYNASDGARGVGRATTQSVVAGSVLILIANYFLSSFLFKSGLG